MREVDEHAEPVHLAHDLLAERGEPTDGRRVRARICPGHVLRVRQRHVARTELVEHAQRSQRVVDRVPPFHPDQRRNPSTFEDPLHVIGRQCELERLRVALHHPIDDVDLFERGGDRGLACEFDRHVHGPELPADTAGPQPFDIGVNRGLRLPDVELVEVVAHFVPECPRVVIVPVDER